jgi:hypothetical protein
MSLKHLADELAARGRYGDTELVHMTKGEVAGLQALAEQAGGSLTVNPDTGKPEAFFLAALLPTILGGVGASMGLGALGTAALGAGVGALTNKRNPLMGAIMGGMGGYGGGQLAGALQGAGANAAQQAAMSAIPQGTTTAAHTAAQQAAMEGLTGAAANEAAARASQQLMAQGFGSDAAIQNLAAGQASRQFMAQPFYQQLGTGVKALGSEAGRTGAMQALGGAKGALKAGSMAAAPMLYESMMPRPMGAMAEEDTVLPRYDYTAGLTGDYYGMGGDNSTRERQFFTQPTFTRRAAAGGIMQLAEGGDTDPKDPARGMTGASAEAMRYLMGQTNASPATQSQQRLIQDLAAAQAATPAPTPVAQPQQLGVMDVMRNPLRLFSGNIGGADGAEGSSSSRVSSANPMFGMMGELFDGKKDEMPRFSYDPLTQRYTRMAEGGIASLAKGGMKAGGFVIPADVVSMVGEGNTEAGYKDIARAIPGATAIRGKDGGQADTVKTSIEGKQPARVAHGEMYVPPAAVKRAGGAKKLYAMMDKVRKQAKGDTKQIKPVDLRKALA